MSVRYAPAQAGYVIARKRKGVGTVRLLVVRPFLWARHRAKMALHAFLVWRKGETGETGEAS